MKGDVVIVRAFGGDPAKVRVWDEDERMVYVVGLDEFERMEAGESERWPIGFERTDVFAYDPRNEPQGAEVDWDSMPRYRDGLSSI